ncbi:MAG: hypothetical protein AAB857_00755 [Patescibacteria group bacterium]
MPTFGRPDTDVARPDADIELAFDNQGPGDDQRSAQDNIGTGTLGSGALKSKCYSAS